MRVVRFVRFVRIVRSLKVVVNYLLLQHDVQYPGNVVVQQLCSVGSLPVARPNYIVRPII